VTKGRETFLGIAVKLVNLIGLILVTWASLAAPGFCIDAGKASVDTDMTIADFEVTGNHLISKDTILEVLKTKPGDKYSRSNLFDDLRRINEIGFFKEKSLQLLPSKLPEHKVLITICVEENAPVTKFSIQGSEVLKIEDISNVFSDQLGKPQNLTRLSSSIDKVEQLYHDKGYVLARFTDVKDFPDGSVNLRINEGQIDKIEISGNEKNKHCLIRNFLTIKPGTIYNDQQLANDLKKAYEQGHFQDLRGSLAPSETNPDMFTLKIEVGEKGTPPPRPLAPKSESELQFNAGPPTIYSGESRFFLFGDWGMNSTLLTPAWRRWYVPQKPHSSLDLEVIPSIIPNSEVQTQQ
jgi:outer membrane protein insertion porin family